MDITLGWDEGAILAEEAGDLDRVFVGLPMDRPCCLVAIVPADARRRALVTDQARRVTLRADRVIG